MNLLHGLLGCVRTYCESAYFSSSGTLSYINPVTEQVAWLYENLRKHLKDNEAK